MGKIVRIIDCMWMLSSSRNRAILNSIIPDIPKVISRSLPLQTTEANNSAERIYNAVHSALLSLERIFPHDDAKAIVQRCPLLKKNVNGCFAGENSDNIPNFTVQKEIVHSVENRLYLSGISYSSEMKLGAIVLSPDQERYKHNIDFFNNHMNDLIPKDYESGGGESFNSAGVSLLNYLIKNNNFASAEILMSIKYGEKSALTFKNFLDGTGSDIIFDMGNFLSENKNIKKSLCSQINNSSHSSGVIKFGQPDLLTDWRGMLGSTAIAWKKENGNIILEIDEKYSWNPEPSSIDDSSVLEDESTGSTYHVGGTGTDGVEIQIPCVKIDGVWYDKRSTYPIYLTLNKLLEKGQAKEFHIKSTGYLNCN